MSKFLEQDEFKLDEKNLAWNIVPKEKYQAIIESVFKNVAERIAFTFGPYGNRTTMDAAGNTLLTKDGFNVLKNISYNNPIYNSVVRLLIATASPVVIGSGDGSSTCTIGAYKLYKIMKESDVLRALRGKDLTTYVEKVTNTIIEKLANNAAKIDPDGDLTEIRQIAMIATDQNEEFANIIHYIYKRTKNPTIEYAKSKSTETTYEIVDGFMGFGLYLDKIYATSDDGLCTIKNPHIICFNYKIDNEDYNEYIIHAHREAINKGQRLVVYAPYYDEYLLEHIKNQAMSEIKSLGTTTIVYCRAPISAIEMAENYNDFAMMAGCQLITEGIKKDLEGQDVSKEILKYVGSVKEIVINHERTVITGFVARNQAIYNAYLNDATKNYEESLNDCTNSGIVTNRLFMNKNRLSRLSGSMGRIKVGGRNLLEKNANYDALEDAVKACESAYTYGYNLGGSLSIPIIIKEMLKTTEDLYEKEVMYCYQEAMLEVFEVVLTNYYEKEEDEGIVKDILSNCVKNETCFDLISKDYSKDIINPCMTDIEVLRGISSMISVLLTSNQYIAVMPEEKPFGM